MPSWADIFDFESFASLLKIRHKTQRKLIDFRPENWYPPQRMLHQAWKDVAASKGLLWFLILKGRQKGVSTFVEARLFHSTITHQNTNSLILADKQSRAEYIYQMCRTMYDFLPTDIKPETKYSSKKELVFDTKDGKGLKSAIYVSTALDQFIGQAMTIHCLHCSEVSSFPYLHDVLTTLIPAVPQTPESIVVLESTAKGAGAEFHQEWLQAKAGQSIFRPIFIPWYLMTEYCLDEDSPLFEQFAPYGRYTKYERTLIKMAKKEFDIDILDSQLAWRRFMIEKSYRGDEDSFNQEMPATPDESFVVAGDTAFSRKRLKEAYEHREPPKRKAEIVISARLEYELKGHIETKENGRLWFWKEPIANHIYRIGIDPATGQEGRDYTAMVVIDEVEKEQVAEFQGWIDVFQAAHYGVILAQFYNNAKLVIEINFGLGCQVEARRYYWNFYRHKYLDRITDKPTEKVGFLSTPSFKKELIQYADHAINEGIHRIYSERLLSELLTFIQRPGMELASAAAGTHDDIVMAWLIAIYTSYQDKDYLGYSSETSISEAEMLTALSAHGVDISEPHRYTEFGGSNKRDEQWMG